MRFAIWFAVISLIGCHSSRAVGDMTISLTQPEHASRHAGKRLRVVSFNVQLGKDIPRLARLIQDSKALRRADILLVQEIEAHPDEPAPRAQQLAQRLGMGHVYAPARTTGRGTHGVAILSRYPITDVEIIQLPFHDLNVNARRRIALAASVEVGRQTLRVYNTHLDTRISPKDRVAQMKKIVRHAADATEPVVIGGDMNTNSVRWLAHVVPIWYSGQAKILDRFMKRHEFSAPTARTGSTTNRWWLRMRLDAIFTRAIRVLDAGVDRTVRISDHFPVWIDMDWPT